MTLLVGYKGQKYSNKSRSEPVPRAKVTEKAPSSTVECNNGASTLSLKHLPAELGAAIYKASHEYYLTPYLIGLINRRQSDARLTSEIYLRFARCRSLGLRLHPFIDRMLSKNKMCLDCYYLLRTNKNTTPCISHKNYNEFNKFFETLQSIDPYTLMPINKGTGKGKVSIEHVLPYSMTLSTLMIDADFQNLCYIDKNINSLRSDLPLRFDKKDASTTKTIVVDGKIVPFDMKLHCNILDNCSTVELVKGKKYFSPPQQSHGYLARKILYCFLTYIGDCPDNFELFYADLNIEKLINSIGANVNVSRECNFEVELENEIYGLQGTSNFCLTCPYFISSFLFNVDTHDHSILNEINILSHIH